MCSGVGDTTQLVPGSPIRTPWDHSSVDSSPRPIAASHVLHRLLVPRHPPFALDNLTKTTNKHSASLQKILKRRSHTEIQDARVHYPHLNKQPTTTRHNQHQTTTHHGSCGMKITE